MKSNYDIHEGLKSRKLAYGLTQREVGEILYTSPQNYKQIEGEINRFKVDDAVKLADFYGVTLDELILREVVE